MTATLLLTGANGQLGRTFRQHWQDSALAGSYQLSAIDVDELDLTRQQALRDWLDARRPQIIVNAAAYTAVERAEQQQELAYRVNAAVVRELALWCRANQAVLVQLSTDFVFDGGSTTPYAVDATTNPLGVYGGSKLAGERHVQALLPDQGIILRTCWLYSEYGNNFVKTMLRLMQQRDCLGIVADQIGSPTSTHSLVRLLFRVIGAGYHGVLHWSDGGELSWYDFAVAIQQAGLACGLLKQAIPLHRLTTDQYPTAVVRPAYSVLERSAALALLEETPAGWQQELYRVVASLAAGDRSGALESGWLE